VDAGNKVAKPTKKVISKIPKPIRDVLQREAQGLVDTTGNTLGAMIATATGDEELGEMVKQGISDTGDELLSGERLSLGSKILPIAKRSVNVVVDQIEDPRYRTVAKEIVKKSGAGLYGKAGSGLTGRGLSGAGLSGSGMRKGEKRSAVKSHVERVRLPPDFNKESGRIHTLPHKPSLPRPAVMPREPRFQKGSQEAKDYMTSIRNNKESSGFFKKIGKRIKKGANNAGKDTKKALFGKRIGDETQFILPIAGGIIGATAGSMAGGPFGSAVGGSAGTAGGKYLADDINKRGYGMKSGKGRKGSMVRPASDVPTFSPYATLYSAQIIHLSHVVVFNMVVMVNSSCKINMCIKYISLTNFDLHRLCKRMDLPIVGVFSKDELEPIPHQIGTYYINMSDAKEPGTHLICVKIVCDEDRDNYKGKKNKEKVCEAIYFDSFGIDMPIEVANYLKNFRPIAYSNRHIQNIHSDV